MSGLELIQAGVVEYGAAQAMQERMVAERAAGTRPDTLLLLQHPPVITLGRGAKREHVLAPAEVLARFGVAVFESTRGGDVTFHGPGQLVAYPILALPEARRNVRGYVTDLEEAVIRTVADFGIRAVRAEGLRGVWVGREKLAAVGVRLSRWITSHGVAVNVAPDLSGFDLIVPCGIADRGVTSMARLLGYAPPLDEVAARFHIRFLEVFKK